MLSENSLPSMTQEEYRTLLEADARMLSERFLEFPKAEAAERWRCRRCGTGARATTIAHPIWDGPFDGAGRGKCDYRQVPFCPSCDGEKPAWESGLPIRIPAVWGEKTLVMQRLAERLYAFGLPPEFIPR